MAVYRLDDDSFWFPDPEEADEEYDGLLAVGGDYKPERLLTAYASGIFPWPVETGKPITWFSPDPRFVLKAEDLHIPKSLVKTLHKGLFEYRVDTATSAWTNPNSKREGCCESSLRIACRRGRDC